MKSSLPSPLRTWLQLFRAPNLFTVPGDPLVGYLLANAGQIDRSLIAAIFASLCCYAGGLLMNDLADEAEDRRERPNRPLPSGAAKRGTVWIVLVLLGGAALAALWVFGNPRALAAGGVLLAAITLYNFLTKHWPVIGALNMGLCRGLSVMLGASVGPIASFQIGIMPALFIGLYIAAITHLARYETRDRIPVHARLLPALVAALACAAGATAALGSPAKAPAAGLFLLTALVVGWLAVKMFAKNRPPLPPLIGSHIRALLPLQAALCYFANPWGLGQPAAVILLCLWPVSRLVSRWFYAS